MSFYADIQAEMEADIYNEDNDMSELIEYWPLGVEGNKREIYAVLERPSASINGSVPRPFFRMHILNKSTNGVTTAELNKGKDQFKFAELKGKAPAPRNPKRKETSDEAEIILIF